MPAETLPDVSRLSDGRLLWYRGKERPLVRVKGSWVPCKDVTVEGFAESIPLDEFEIKSLVEAGIFEL